MLITGSTLALSRTCFTLGTSTSMPNSITCAVILKMISSTSTTSTNGVTLISESAGVPWNRRRPGAPPPLTLIAMPSLPVAAFSQIQEFEREVVHARSNFLEDVAEVVIENGCRNRRCQAHRCRDQ